MGGKGSSSATAGQDAAAQTLAGVAKSSDARSGQLFGATFPGIKTAEDYYTKLSTGDPGAIQRAIAPAADQIKAAAQASKDSVMNTMPRGGEMRLASEGADISSAAQIGHLATQAYTSSFPALAALGGQGVGLSINSTANAISAASGAGQIYGNEAQQQAAGKASTLGFLGSIAGAGGTAAAGLCWIAKKIFGEYSMEFLRMRYWVNYVMPRTLCGKLLHALYARCGERVAESPWVGLLRPLFTAGLRKAERETCLVPVYLVDC